ncbi:hypothetical protein J2794_000237 [Paraburkholderia terricola]|nr:hypothetical protein [Paraburkholderia terricola]
MLRDTLPTGVSRRFIEPARQLSIVSGKAEGTVRLTRQA